VPGQRGRDRLRGLAALVASLALVVGLPVALWVFGGPPWPQTAPSMDWLTQPVGADVVTRALVLVLWIAWAHFVVCLAAELVAERRGYGLAAQVPGGSLGTQSLARRLVAAVLLLVGSATVTVPAAQAAAGSVRPETAPETVAVSLETKASEPMESPVPDRTAGHTGQAQTKPAARGGRVSYTVQPPRGRHYDSLWDIAERFLGDGRRYKEIYVLNKGRLQADGRMLREADLIYPGWVMAMPDDAKGPGLTVRAQPAPPPRRAGGTGGVRADGGVATGRSAAATTPVDRDDSFGQFGVGGALLAAGLLTGLLRRRGWNGGGEGALAPETEVPLRLAADDSLARFVDRALRCLADAMRKAGRAMPSIYAAYLDGDVLSIALAPAADTPPAGWTSDDDGRIWTVQRPAVEASDVPPDVLAPCPGLVTVGTLDDGRLVLLDLEAAPGLVSLGGDLETAREVGVSVAVELATNVWSDQVSVTLVGFGDDLTELAPHRARRIDDVDEVLDELDRQRSRQHNVCVRGGLDSVIRGRQAKPDPALWKPHFLVLSGVPTADQLARLSELAADPRHAIGVVAIGDVVSAPWRMVVTGDGRLHDQVLGLDVRAQRLPVSAYSGVVELFRRAGGERRIGPGELDPAAAPALDPALLDLERPAPVSVQLLGTPQVDAAGELDHDRRELATELVALVALHPDGVHPGVLEAAIWPGGVSAEVRDAAIGHVQRWLGSDTPGRPRLHQDATGRWRLDLSAVRVDWHVFQALLERAPDDAAGDLAAALSMLRGKVLDGLPPHRYAWLARSATLRDINLTIVEAARRLSHLASSAGDPILARDALRTGLRAVPACEELWCEALRLADLFGTRDDVATEATDMYAAIAKDGSPRGATAQTDALVDELLPGFRRQAA
jgi:hypothetical protein